MRTSSFLAILSLSTAALVGCIDTSSSGEGPLLAAGGSAGAGGPDSSGTSGHFSAGSAGTGGPGVTCPPNTGVAYGVPFDKTQACAATEAAVTPIACLAPDEIAAGYFCARRRSDGREFIGFSSYGKPVLDEATWESCPWDGQAPTPCYGLTCALGAPTSTCTLAGTTKMLKCGDGTTGRDKNCCLRKECASNNDCAASQTCKEVGGIKGWECWPLGPKDACDCAGIGLPLNPRKMCVDLDEL